mmetsp:Transcript_13308/g.34882  ORF Transcript_13308/g.34882 Transcript_13308/m.34882 type:complete len:559 (-) Transcript_13308:78-1754(-)
MSRDRERYGNAFDSDSESDGGSASDKEMEEELKKTIQKFHLDEEVDGKMQSDKNWTKLDSRINTKFLADDSHDLGAKTTTAIASIKDAHKKESENRVRHTDRSDRATSEQVLDPRTRMILYKMLKNDYLKEINGCLSTGKEANVYQAVGPDDSEYAVKIYKTSILVFKDRDRYVTGDYRFRKGYSKHNPRKMVQMWAEKEYRNLNRINQAGIPSPKPILLKLHVLVMELVGGEGWAAPRLKNADLTQQELGDLYWELVGYMRIMYQDCRLVHGDLSEYNILYHQGKLFIIDVSQSVEHDHPMSLDFLRKDVKNVTEFFGVRGVVVLRERELFDFVTQDSQKSLPDMKEEWKEMAATRPQQELTVEDAINEEVFRNAYIPRSLQDVVDAERDTEMIAQGNTSELYYASLTGLTESASKGGERQKKEKREKREKKEKKEKSSSSSTALPSNEEEVAVVGEGREEKGEEEERRGEKEEREGENESDSEDGSTSDSGESESEDEDEEGEGEGERRRTPLTAEEKRNQRKENKKKVKEEQREKRKTKLPKKVKKKKEKAGKRK